MGSKTSVIENFKWIDGTQVSSNWALLEPNNGGSFGNQLLEGCLLLKYHDYTFLSDGYYFSDEPCSDNYGFICEILY